VTPTLSLFLLLTVIMMVMAATVTTVLMMILMMMMAVTVLMMMIDDDGDGVYRAAEFELQELKLSVDGRLRSRDDGVRQLQKIVSKRFEFHLP